jgi:succinate dehydrogenase/fumarate reductase flavoprotein subunit
MLAAARWIYSSALERRETRGVHRRRDYGAPDGGPPKRFEIRGVDHILVEQAQ